MAYDHWATGHWATGHWATGHWATGVGATIRRGWHKMRNKFIVIMGRR